MAEDKVKPIEGAGGTRQASGAGKVNAAGAQTPRAESPTGTARSKPDGFTPSEALLDEEDETQKADDPKKNEDAKKPEDVEDPETDPERERLQKEIEDKQKQLKDALAKGDYETADQLMQDIEGLVDKLENLGGPVRPPKSDPGQPAATIPPAGTGGDGTGGAGAPQGNVPYYGGDAPPMYPGSGGGPRESGGTGMTPQEVEAIRGQLPNAGDRQGLVNTALDIAGKGLPYVWGGNGPQDGGYDCSGFTKDVYAKNGIDIPRTAQTQFDHCKKQGNLLEGRGTDLLKNAKPGDLLFFDNPYAKKTSDIGHVMMYLGNGKMVGAQSDGVKAYDVGSMGKYLRGVGRPQ